MRSATYVLTLAALLVAVTAARAESVEEDLELGRMTVQEIYKRPREYPILPERLYPESYAHLRRILGRVLESPAIEYRDVFKYNEIKIIRDDQTLNAFCTAGGYIFVYTGLIKYLDAEDHLAGVLGHEIAHAERRHVVEQMEKDKRRQRRGRVIGAAGGRAGRTAGRVVQVASELLNLRYSRGQEDEADRYSVTYLSTSDDYACDGAAGFFQKLETDDSSGTGVPGWLSSHPDSADRIKRINDHAAALECSRELSDGKSYQEFKKSLP